MELRSLVSAALICKLFSGMIHMEIIFIDQF